MEIPFAEIEGTPIEIGRAVGERFGDRIRRTIERHADLNRKYVADRHTVEGAARYNRLVRLHRERFPDFVAELEGMAFSSEVAFDLLFLINLRGEYREFTETKDPAGCSTCSLPSDGLQAFAHNEDGLPLYDNETYILKVHPPSKPAFCAFCYPGFLPGNAFGFNAQGICFSVNNLQPLAVREGLGRHFIARSLLETQSVSEALAAVQPKGRASGFNYTIGSLRERRLFGIEVSPHHSAVQEITGAYFHANHYIAMAETAQRVSKSSRRRQQTAEWLIRDERLRGKKGALRVLRDRSDKRYPILRDAKAPDTLTTLVTALFDMESRRFQMFRPGGAASGGSTGPVMDLPLALT